MRTAHLVASPVTALRLSIQTSSPGQVAATKLYPGEEAAALPRQLRISLSDSVLHKHWKWVVKCHQSPGRKRRGNGPFSTSALIC